MMTQYNYPTPEMQDNLSLIARKILQSGKGILAADETTSLMEKRLEPFNIKNNEENRRLYRQLLITAAPDIFLYISAIVLTEETLNQKTDDGENFRDILQHNNIIIGVQVDKGLIQLKCTDQETITKGLDNLADICERIKEKNCEFTKFRCALLIGESKPSAVAIQANANVMARFAAISQSQGLVPVINAEVSREGDHGLERCRNVTEVFLSALFKSLEDHQVHLEGIILQTNMIVPGKLSKEIVRPSAIGKATISTMRRCVPSNVPGITFLSGGQTEEMATIHLNEINKKPSLLPWKCTFAFGRALLDSAFKIWAETLHTPAMYCSCKAQACLIRRARANSYAAKGDFILEKSS